VKLHKKILSDAIKILGYNVMRIEYDFLIMEKNIDKFERNKYLYNYMLKQHLIDLLKKCKVNCILDVGANRGQYALELRKLGYKENIISFEPVKESFDELKKWSRFDSKWTVYPFALGEKNFTTQIHVTDETQFSSLFKPNLKSKELFGNISKVKRKQEVEVRRLDFVLSKIVDNMKNPYFFLKIDTQGYDLQVFSGLGEYVEKVVGLQSEVSVIPIYEGGALMSEALSFYESHGFRITGLFPVSIDRSTFRVIEFDCTMVNHSFSQQNNFLNGPVSITQSKAF
jgi:FkbM family methyltransferase